MRRIRYALIAIMLVLSVTAIATGYYYHHINQNKTYDQATVSSKTNGKDLLLQVAPHQTPSISSDPATPGLNGTSSDETHTANPQQPSTEPASAVPSPPVTAQPPSDPVPLPSPVPTPTYPCRYTTTSACPVCPPCGYAGGGHLCPMVAGGGVQTSYMCVSPCGYGSGSTEVMCRE